MNVEFNNSQNLLHDKLIQFYSNSIKYSFAIPFKSIMNFSPLNSHEFPLSTITKIFFHDSPMSKDTEHHNNYYLSDPQRVE